MPKRRRRAEFALVSPNHPEIERWTTEPGVLEQLAELRDGGWEREDRKLEEVAFVETGRSVIAPGIPHPLPVLISPSVDARFGPTAVLGIPSVDRTDEAIFEQLDPAPSLWRGPEAPLVTRPTKRFRASDFPISRQRAWGAPIPIVHCDACGTVPVPRDQLPVRLPDDLTVTAEGNALLDRPDFIECECPSCGKPARRETDTLDCHFDAASQHFPLLAPTADRGRSLIDHPELERWLPGRVVHQRRRHRQLRPRPADDHEGAARSRRLRVPAGRRAVRRDVHARDGEARGAQDEQAPRQHRHPARDRRAHRRGRAALRDAPCGGAREGVHLGREHAHVLDAASSGGCGRTPSRGSARRRARLPTRSTSSDGLRRKLATWCNTAIERITQDYAALDMHRATRNLMTLFTRIEDFESRVVARRAEPTPEDREAIVYALRLLVRLLAPVAPHLAEELWARSGSEGFVADAGWPEPSEA